MCKLVVNINNVRFKIIHFQNQAYYPPTQVRSFAKVETNTLASFAIKKDTSTHAVFVIPCSCIWKCDLPRILVGCFCDHLIRA